MPCLPTKPVAMPAILGNRNMSAPWISRLRATGLFNRLPLLHSLRAYRWQHASQDLTAAMIVTLMLVPQALAYALLSGLPAQVGLYASVLPLVAYALFGTSSTLSVGPVAVAALMTANAIAPYAAQSTALGMQAAAVLAAIVGAVLLCAGLLRLGFLAHFLSHPVIAGFMAATSLLIASSQLPMLLGLTLDAHTVPALWQQLYLHAADSHLPTVVLSVLSVLVLWFTRAYGQTLFQRLGWSAAAAQTLCRAMPALLVVAGACLMQAQWPALQGVRTLGEIPAGLPGWHALPLTPALWQGLWLPAVMIAIVGSVESLSVAQSLAMQRRERLVPDQELIAIGAANLAASVSGGQPVAGGVSRSVVNMQAGARTPMAGLMTAVGMAVATLTLTAWLGHIPRLILAATIVLAVLTVFDPKVFVDTWRTSRSDWLALMATFVVTLWGDVETGLMTGVCLSLGLHIYRSSRPHIAVVGRVPGTEHFRNVDRHAVQQCADVVTLRVDQSLYFANARFLEQAILKVQASQPTLKHLILMCSAINEIDSSALEVLTSINHDLQQAGIGFHLSEVKGPVMDRLQHAHFLQQLHGQVFLTQYQAYQALACVSAADT